MLSLLLAASLAQCPGGVCPIQRPAPQVLYQQGYTIPVQPAVVYYPQNPPVIRLQPTYTVQPVYYYRPVDSGPFLQYWPPVVTYSR